jgi:hypothetical protein
MEAQLVAWLQVVLERLVAYGQLCLEFSKRLGDLLILRF